jgi:hypothetical protein
VVVVAGGEPEVVVDVPHMVHDRHRGVGVSKVEAEGAVEGLFGGAGCTAVGEQGVVGVFGAGSVERFAFYRSNTGAGSIS